MFFSFSCLTFYFIPTISTKDSRIKILTKLSILSSVIILGYHSDEFLTSKNVQRQRRIYVCSCNVREFCFRFTSSRARFIFVHRTAYVNGSTTRRTYADSNRRNACFLSFLSDFPETFISLEIRWRTNVSDCGRVISFYRWRNICQGVVRYANFQLVVDRYGSPHWTKTKSERALSVVSLAVATGNERTGKTRCADSCHEHRWSSLSFASHFQPISRISSTFQTIRGYVAFPRATPTPFELTCIRVRG